MGLAYARLDQHEQAVAALEKVVELQPMSGEGFYQLGMAYHHAKRPDDVTKIVKRLVGFEPKRARKLVKDAGRTDSFRTFLSELPLTAALSRAGFRFRFQTVGLSPQLRPRREASDNIPVGKFGRRSPAR